MIRNNLKLALRNLLKSKLYSAIIIGGFSIGFTAFFLIALFYNSEHNINTCYDNHQNIYRIYDIKRNRFNLDYELYPTIKNNYPEVENACPFEYVAGFEFTVKDSETNNSVLVDKLIVTSNTFFEVFSVTMLSGISDIPFSVPNSIVVSRSFAKKLYGDENPLGKRIVHDFFTGVITAIIEDFPQNSSFKGEILLNSENKEYQLSQSSHNGISIYPTHHFLAMDAKADKDLFAKKLNATIGQYNSNTDSLALQKLTDIYLSDLPMKDAHRKGNAKMLRVFFFIAILIILLSSANYLNYTTSMQFAKMKVIGIYKTNGAGMSRLIASSFIEVSFGIFISLLLSVILSFVFLPYSNVLFGREILFSNTNYSQLIKTLVTVLIGIIVINSLAPIYILSKFNVTDFLKEKYKSNKKQLGKQSILVFQLTVSIALIVVVISLFKQIQFVKNHDLGFDKEHLVRIDLPQSIRNTHVIANETRKLPSVQGSTLSFGYPGWINRRLGANIENSNFSVNCIYVSEDYLETMGINLVDGRDFLPSDQGKTCLMNESAIKQFKWDNIENKKFDNGGGFMVIGKIKDFNFKSLHSAIDPVALIYDPAGNFNTLSVRLVPGDISKQIAQIKKLWNKLVPDDPMNFTFYDDQFQALYNKEEKLAKSVTLFSLIAVILTCMGILGQIFIESLKKTKEIGIRKVNGAKITEVLAMLNKDFVKWVAIAFVIACPIAYYAMNKWLENFAYKTTLSWWIFALAGVLALGIALLTVSWQSWRAATRNPVEALRYE